MDHLSAFYPESKFGGYTDIDGTLAFYMRVQSLVTPDAVMLDIGCGRGAHRDDTVATRRDLRTFKGRVRSLIGLDVDKAAAQNPDLDRFVLLTGHEWPLADSSVDLILCDNVIEHLEQPDVFFSEMRRVLKNGGYVCIRTPNAWSYVALVSRLVPNERHARVLGKAQDGRKAEDVFPTFYRCNTIFKMRAMLAKHGFEHVVYGHEAEPSYLSFSKIAYRFGVWHQRFAPGFMRTALFAFGRLKKSDG